MRFISYKFFPWGEKRNFYTLQLVVSIIKIKSLIMLIIITIAKMANILYRDCYIPGTVLNDFRMIISRVWNDGCEIVVTDYSIL